jgi:flavin-dependent dehydrogenase
MNVGVVGAGPGGSLLALRLAEAGARVAVFDASHPREKPCGGGITGKALRILPAGPPSDPLPARSVSSCRFEDGEGHATLVSLDEPVAVASRSAFDGWLLRRAVEKGARHVSERVAAVSPGEVRTTTGRVERFDVVVGADGATSLVRRTFASPLPKERLVMAAGFFVRGTSPMLVRFTPPLAGYLWLFPRPDHVGVGICAPLGQVPTRELQERLRREIARDFPALGDPDAEPYAHTIPFPSADPRSILEIAGPGWALVGDAAALCDPITGEGIFYALRSAALLAETLLADGSTARYPERALEDFGRDLLKAAALHARFYSPGFAQRMIRYSARSSGVRRVLGDLVLGEQGYVGLKRRLLRTGPRFLVEAGMSRLLGLA